MAKIRLYKRSKNHGAIEMIDFTWEYVHDNLEAMKKEFRDSNQTDAVLSSDRKDRSYDEFCTQLQDFLDTTNLDDIDMQYRFEEAKRRREKNISPW